VQGQVGRIQIPELAQTVLLAQLSGGDSSLSAGSGNDQKGMGEGTGLTSSDDGWGRDPDITCPQISPQEPSPTPTTTLDRGEYGEGMAGSADSGSAEMGESGGFVPTACAAPVNVAAFMPELGLEMKLARPAIWYSMVETIPPVGTTASVTIEPVDLVADGRVVGQLTQGKVCFREVVSRTELEDATDFHSDRVAQN
jgi:hypothetical protein